MKTIEEKVEILEEKILIVEKHVSDTKFMKENPYKPDSTEEMEISESRK